MNCYWCGKEGATVERPNGPDTTGHYCGEACVRAYMTRCPYEGDRTPPAATESEIVQEAFEREWRWY